MPRPFASTPNHSDPSPRAGALGCGPLAGGQSAAAVLLAEGEGGGGDPTHGADLGSGAAAEAGGAQPA